MTDSSQTQTSQPSADDEARKYVEQLRSAPADQVLTEIVLGVVNAAQVKLGRPDARVFIDLTAAMLETVGSQLKQESVTMVDQTLAQLRMAQVEAEAQAASDKDAKATDE